MRIIKASEISTYIFCQRAWWYQKQGISSSNEQQISAGTALHLQHGKTMLVVGFLRLVGYILLLAAIGLLAAAFTQTFLLQI